MTAHSLFLALFLAAAVAPVAAQTAEATVWDKYTQNCSTSSPAGAQIYAVNQTGTSEVEVYFSGYSNYPIQLWLTDQAGTTIAYTDDDNKLNLAGGTHLKFDSATLSDQPTQIQAHTCPPSTGSVQSATVKTWRGIYDDATNNCCSDSPITAQEIIDYGPTIAVGTGCCAAGTWGAQQFKYTATKKSALLYVQDSAGRIIHLQEHTAGEVAAAGSYDSGFLTIPAGSTSLRACALLTTGDTADQRNPICTDISFTTEIAVDLETSANNPKTHPDQWFLNVSYSGSEENPIGVYTREDFAAANSNSDEFCITYARNESGQTGTIIGMAKGALEVKLNDAISKGGLAATPKLWLYSCCGVSVVPANAGSPRFSSPRDTNTGPPYFCPDGTLYETGLDLATEVSAAKAAIKSAGGGTIGSLSSVTGSKCDGGLYSVGEWKTNFTSEGAFNCSCVLPDGEIAPSWSCSSLNGKKVPLWRESGILGLALTGAFAVLIVAIALGYVFLRNRGENASLRPSTFGSVKFGKKSMFSKAASPQQVVVETYQ